jgi:cytochrome c
MKRAILMVLSLMAAAGSADADGDAAIGERIYKKCVACHSIVDAANKLGPSLLGIVDKKAGAAEGYAYSAAFKTFAEAGAVWDDKTLDAWIANPKSVVKGSKMAFVGLKNETERADLIAFLKTKK